jgi:iron uptake system EfeUOB component EfeO/EfeM
MSVTPWRTAMVNESDFEGTLVLEKLAVIEKVDEFFEAIDSDDFETAKRLMKAARVDVATIEIVLRKMAESDGNH